MFGKINRHVQFESTLDVPCSEEATKIIGYDLVGLVVHHGASVHSGHYVAYVKVTAPVLRPTPRPAPCLPPHH